jgi:hypothetical protein
MQAFCQQCRFCSGIVRDSGGGNATLSTPAAQPSSAVQPLAWLSKPPSPSDLSLGAPRRLNPKPQRPTDRFPAALPPSISRSLPPKPAVQKSRRSSKLGVKRPLKRAYVDEEEWEGDFEEPGPIARDETETGAEQSALEQPVDDDEVREIHRIHRICGCWEIVGACTLSLITLICR